MTMNFVTFNQDYSHLAVGEFICALASSSVSLTPSNAGTSRGFRIYITEPFQKCFETKEGDIAILEMLFSTSLVALILSPRRLQITNTKVRYHVCRLWGIFSCCEKARIVAGLRTLKDRADVPFPFSPETLSHMRTHVFNHCACSTIEPQETGGRTRRFYLSIRH